MDKQHRVSFLLLSSEKRTFLNRNYYGSRDVFLAALECLKDNVMILRVLRLIKIIPILSNLKIRMDGIITKIEEFAFSRYTFRNR